MANTANSVLKTHAMLDTHSKGLHGGSNPVHRLLRDYDPDAALIASALPFLARALLERSRGVMLSLSYDLRSSADRSPLLHLWAAPDAGRPRLVAWGDVDMGTDEDEWHRLRCGGRLVLHALVGCWPPGTVPDRIGLGTDGRTLSFDMDDADPLAPGWIERRALMQSYQSGAILH